MDETTRAALKIALEVAVRDRDRAVSAIALLSEKLGLQDQPSSVVLAAGEAPAGDGLRDVGPVHVADGEFYGLSQTAAAQVFLERAGRTRPQRTEQVVAALAQGGVRIGGKNPPTDTLYKILNRDHRFHRPAPNTWGLSAWYPNLQRKTPRADASTDSTPPVSSDTPSVSNDEPPTDTVLGGSGGDASGSPEGQAKD